jgi:spectinomycin phosphotransferase
MLEKPELQDEQLLNCLEDTYGLSVDQITFLPVGGDLSTAVYRVVAGDKKTYFCKLRRGGFNKVTVELPAYLSKQGIAQIISPIETDMGQLWTELDEFKLVLYPFIEGSNGYDVELSEHQWADFGAACQQIHAMNPPVTLFPNIRKEDYSSEWRERCKNIMNRIHNETSKDPITLDMIAFLHAKREMILNAVVRAEQLAHMMRSRSMGFVLCHSDIHPGNLFIDKAENLFIVDWDYPVLAPKERDLMFIGGGQGFIPYLAEREEQLFYQGYGPANLDPVALVYYRYERCVTDLSVECERILSNALRTETRAQALEILKLYFLPGCTMEIAAVTDQSFRIS